MTDAVTHALSAASPRTRYIVGKRAMAMSWLSQLPCDFGDTLLRVFLKETAAEAFPGPCTELTQANTTTNTTETAKVR